MAERRQSKERHRISSDAALAGILALLVDERENRPSSEDRAMRKTEAVLANAGLSIEEIAMVTGKNYNAVRMAIARARGR
jgi:DNA-directed RNA polymerase specialized sigma24 family protein